MTTPFVPFQIAAGDGSPIDYSTLTGGVLHMSSSNIVSPMMLYSDPWAYYFVRDAGGGQYLHRKNASTGVVEVAPTGSWTQCVDEAGYGYWCEWNNPAQKYKVYKADFVGQSVTEIATLPDWTTDDYQCATYYHKGKVVLAGLVNSGTNDVNARVATVNISNNAVTSTTFPISAPLGGQAAPLVSYAGGTFNNDELVIFANNTQNTGDYHEFVSAGCINTETLTTYPASVWPVGAPGSILRYDAPRSGEPGVAAPLEGTHKTYTVTQNDNTDYFTTHYNHDTHTLNVGARLGGAFSIDQVTWVGVSFNAHKAYAFMAGSFFKNAQNVACTSIGLYDLETNTQFYYREIIPQISFSAGFCHLPYLDAQDRMRLLNTYTGKLEVYKPGTLPTEETLPNYVLPVNHTLTTRAYNAGRAVWFVLYDSSRLATERYMQYLYLGNLEAGKVPAIYTYQVAFKVTD